MILTQQTSLATLRNNVIINNLFYVENNTKKAYFSAQKSFLINFKAWKKADVMEQMKKIDKFMYVECMFLMLIHNNRR